MWFTRIKRLASGLAGGRLVLVGVSVAAILGSLGLRWRHLASCSSGVECHAVAADTALAAVAAESPPLFPLEIALNRYQRIQSAAPVVWKDHTRAPGVAILFLTTRGLEHPALWQRWFEDGFQTLRERGFDRADLPGNDPSRFRSDVLRAYVHAPPFMDLDIVSQFLPPALQPGLVRDPAPCGWGWLNPCTARLLEVAIANHPQAQWFFLVSSDAIPVKRFDFFYDRLLRDGRSRMAWAGLYFDAGLPKFANWVLLSREHADILNTRQADWTSGRFHSNYTWAAAATDETMLMKPILEVQGEEAFSRFDPGPFLLPWRLKPLGENSWAFHCWQGSCLAVGDVADGGWPVRYQNFTRAGIEKLVREPTLYTARKVVKDGYVHGCSGLRNTSPPRNTPDVDTPGKMSRDEVAQLGPEAWAVADETADVLRRPYGLFPTESPAGKIADADEPLKKPSDCLLLDFMSWRLGLQSSATFQEPKVNSFVLPSNTKHSMPYDNLVKILRDYPDKTNLYGLRADL